MQHKTGSGDEEIQQEERATPILTPLTPLVKQPNKVKENIIVYKFSNGGFVKRHHLVDCNDGDYPAALDVAYDKAIKGDKVFILPNLNEKDPLRETVFDGAKANKCPDLRINGEFVEIKTPLPGLHKRKIKNNIQHASKQADHVIIRLVENYNIKELKQIAKERFLEHAELQTIEFKLNGYYYHYERKVLIKI